MTAPACSITKPSSSSRSVDVARGRHALDVRNAGHQAATSSASAQDSRFRTFAASALWGGAAASVRVPAVQAPSPGG
jgi:hypothetical protein